MNNDCPPPYFLKGNEAMNESLSHLVRDANTLGQRALSLIKGGTLTVNSLKKSVKKVMRYNLTRTPAAVIITTIQKVWG